MFKPRPYRFGRTYYRSLLLQNQNHQLLCDLTSKAVYGMSIDLLGKMERRIVGDTLLKSRMSPLLSFLAPSLPPLCRSTAASRQVRMVTLKPLKLRYSGIHTTACKYAESSPNTANIDFPEDKPKPNTFRSVLSPRPKDDVPGKQLHDLLNSAFDSPSPAKRDPSQPFDESSADMIENAFRDSLRNRELNKAQQAISQRMQFPTTDASISTMMASDPRRTVGITKNVARRAKRTVKSRPTVGRTVEVVPERGFDVGRALRSLEISCSANKVRADQARQRYHERPGLQRKRLKSQRWRKMFKESFRATVMRVREMRRKGW